VARYQNNNLLGIGLMLLATMLFSIMDAIAKWLVTAEVSPIQVIAVRGWMITLFIPLLLFARGELQQLATRQPLRHLARGMLGFLAPFSFFTALKSLPLADASVVFFSAAFMLTAASALFLKERVGIHRWSAVVVGFVGVLVIVRPGSEGFTAFSLWAIAAVIFITIRDLCTRRLSHAVPGMSVIAVTSILVTASAGLGSIAQGWAPFGAVHVALLFGSASFLIVGYLFSVSSMRIGEIGFVQPFRYTLMIWAILVGLFVFDEWPDAWTLIGVAIVIATGLYTLHRERRAARV